MTHTRTYTLEEKLEELIRDALKQGERVKHVGASRENSLVLTKLEEALLWNRADQEKKGLTFP